MIMFEKNYSVFIVVVVENTHVDRGDDAPPTQRRVVGQLEPSGHDTEDGVHVQPLPEPVPPRVLDQERLLVGKLALAGIISVFFFSP